MKTTPRYAALTFVLVTTACGNPNSTSETSNSTSGAGTGPEATGALGGSAGAISGGAAASSGTLGETGGTLSSAGAADPGTSGTDASAGSGGASMPDPNPNGGGAGQDPGSNKLKRLLAYSLVVDHGHTGAGADEALLQELGTEHGFEVVVTEDPADFTSANLAGFQVIAFSSPSYTGQMISDEGRAAIEAFVRNGGGWIGWHYGLWVEVKYGWDFMKVLGGGTAVFAHGPGGTYTPMNFKIQDKSHPVVQGLGDGFLADREDWLHWYGLDKWVPSPNTVILARTDLPLAGFTNYPTMWVTEIDNGRSFYNMLGHGGKPFMSPEGKLLMWNAIKWVSRSGE